MAELDCSTYHRDCLTILRRLVLILDTPTEHTDLQTLDAITELIEPIRKDLL